MSEKESKGRKKQASMEHYLATMRQAGALPSEGEPQSAEEPQPDDEFRARLWGEAPRKGVWVISLGRRGRIVLISLLSTALLSYLIGAAADVVVLEILGGVLGPLGLCAGAAMTHRIVVDREARTVFLRLGILPFFAFSYPLGSVQVEYVKAFGLLGKDHHMLYWKAKEQMVGPPRISDAFKIHRTQILSLKDRDRVFAEKQRITALLDPPARGG